MIFDKESYGVEYVEQNWSSSLNYSNFVSKVRAIDRSEHKSRMPVKRTNSFGNYFSF